MKKNTFIMIFIALITNTVCFSVDIQEGKKAFETDCVKCHDSSLFDKPNNQKNVKDLKSLKKQVKQCATASGASWFEEDEENVVAYLNETFYKFKN
jgi:cytochrome c2